MSINDIHTGSSTRKAWERSLNKRLEGIGWGLFFIMAGGMNLVSEEAIPGGSWLIGVGLIMLGANFARYVNGIKASNFTLVLGTLALLSGIGDVLGMDMPILPILLILIGANLLLSPIFERSRG